MKLRLFDLAFEELEAIGNPDDAQNCYEGHPTLYPELKGNNKKYVLKPAGSFVPYVLRVFRAEVAYWVKKATNIHDFMYDLLTVARYFVNRSFYRRRHEIESLEVAIQESDTQGRSLTDSQLLDSSPKLLPNALTPIPPNGTPLMSFYKMEDPVLKLRGSLALWKRREHFVLFSILTRLLIDKEFILAIEMTKIMIAKYPKNVELPSILGRIHLQMGSLQSAALAFRYAENNISHPETSPQANFNR